MSCPGSVALSEGLPDKSSPWSIEGTEAHEVLETILVHAIKNGTASVGRVLPKFDRQIPRDMLMHAISAANFILATFTKARLHGVDPEILVESRVYLDFIHPEMFGTFDGAVVDHFGTLHVFDYKYGQGHAVSPEGNLQMIFYGIGLAHRYRWNFKRVRLWIIQPRIRGYEGPLYWELPILDLKNWVANFEYAVSRIEREPDTYVEGSHCHWCKAKGICPLKRDAKVERARAVFAAAPEQPRVYAWMDPQVEVKDLDTIESELAWRKRALEKAARMKNRT